MPATLEGEFALVGTMARPAGVSGLMGGGNATEFYGKMLAKGSDRGLHALRTASPYAERAEPGWEPLEPETKPSWADRGAGTVSAGCIDNTYMPSPLKNKWGKQRELSKAEVIVLPHKQATDLLATTMGATTFEKAAVEDMLSIREPYSATIPLFHPIDPLRAEAGFVRIPNIIPGAKPPPTSPWKGEQPGVPEDWKAKKLAYEAEQRGLGRIPVLKKVTTTAERGSVSDHAAFLRVSAGLPGGLSLIPPKASTH